MPNLSRPPWALGRLNSGASAPISGTATFCLRRVNIRPSLRVLKVFPEILQAVRALDPWPAHARPEPKGQTPFAADAGRFSPFGRREAFAGHWVRSRGRERRGLRSAP